MNGHQPFSNLTANFSPKRKAKIAAQTQELKSAMALNELREAFSLVVSQKLKQTTKIREEEEI